MPEKNDQVIESDVLWGEYHQLVENRKSVTPEQMRGFLRKLKLDPAMEAVHEQAFSKMWTGRGESFEEWGNLFARAEQDPKLARKILVDVSKRLCKAYRIRPVPVYFDKESPAEKFGDAVIPDGTHEGIFLYTSNSHEGARRERTVRQPHILLWENSLGADNKLVKLPFIRMFTNIVHETAHYFQQELHLKLPKSDSPLYSSAVRLNVVSRIETDILFNKFPQIANWDAIYADNPKEIDARGTEKLIRQVDDVYGFLHMASAAANSRNEEVGKPPARGLKKILATVQKTNIYQMTRKGARTVSSALAKLLRIPSKKDVSSPEL